MENTPPTSTGATRQGQASVETSLWESLPPSLLVEQQMPNDCCRVLQQKLAVTLAELKALQQQVIYTEVFFCQERD